MEKPLLESNSRTRREDLATLARRIVAAYGPGLQWRDLKTLLEDRHLIPVPCELRFDADPLLPGECAHLAPLGVDPEDGFVLYLHPTFASQLSAVPLLVLHHLGWVVTDGKASPEEAEGFGAAVLGITPEAYYEQLCDLAGQLGGDDLC
jgi:hypothetical protein